MWAPRDDLFHLRLEPNGTAPMARRFGAVAAAEVAMDLAVAPTGEAVLLASFEGVTVVEDVALKSRGRDFFLLTIR